MKSSAKQCQLAFIVSLTICGTCCPVLINSHCLNGLLVSMIGIFQKVFAETFRKQIVVAFTRLSMESSAKHCQPALFVNEILSNACCPLVFNSQLLDGLLESMNPIRIVRRSVLEAKGGHVYQTFDEILCNTLSTSAH